MESGMNELIKASLDGIKSAVGSDAVIGDPIHTPSGVTVIPVSKLTVGFAGGGVDFLGKKSIPNQSVGSGGGSGVSITPMAFLTVSKDADIRLINLSDNAGTSVQRITSLIENSPDIIARIKSIFG